MWVFEGLLCVVATLGTVTSSPPCIQVTHSDCVDDDDNLLNELTLPDKSSCQSLCTNIGPDCKFSLYDHEPFARGNCRLYDEDLFRFISHCNEIAGPKVSPDDCDVEFPPDDSCQVYRQGQCGFSEVQKHNFTSSWENCQAVCQADRQCKYWQFLKKEKLCMILYEEEKTCAWEFSPRIPEEEKCDDSPATTSKPPASTTTGQQGICKQIGRNPIPGVDCSHDFYCCNSVGDSTPRLCACNNGLWYDQDFRKCLWGDMLDPPCPWEDKTVGHNIEKFTWQDHVCNDGWYCD